MSLYYIAGLKWSVASLHGVFMSDLWMFLKFNIICLPLIFCQVIFQKFQIIAINSIIFYKSCKCMLLSCRSKALERYNRMLIGVSPLSIWTLQGTKDTRRTTIKIDMARRALHSNPCNNIISNTCVTQFPPLAACSLISIKMVINASTWQYIIIIVALEPQPKKLACTCMSYRYIHGRYRVLLKKRTRRIHYISESLRESFGMFLNIFSLC